MENFNSLDENLRAVRVTQELVRTGDTFCDHPLTVSTRYPDASSVSFKTICPTCQQYGPTKETEAGSQVGFWKENATFRNLVIDNLVKIIQEQKPKEGTMPTYEEGYRKGVKDGTESLCSGFPESKVLCGWVNEKLEERRKKLLIRKITKWVIVVEEFPHGELFVADGTLWDSELSATNVAVGRYGTRYLGVLPIEIEVPV